MALDEKKQIISNVGLMYCKIQNSVPKYKATEEHQKEFCLDIVLDKETNKQLKGKFNRKIKAIETDEFEDTYKVAPPFPEQPMQYVMKLTTNAFIKNKATKEFEEIEYDNAIRPKVWNEDGEDITRDVLVANGSMGDVHFSTAPFDDGVSIFLRNVLVTELIPYEAPDKEDEESEAGETTNPFGKVKKKAVAKKITKTEEVAEEEDDSCPFA